jgi:hypothetical protein
MPKYYFLVLFLGSVLLDRDSLIVTLLPRAMALLVISKRRSCLPAISSAPLLHHRTFLVLVMPTPTFANFHASIELFCAKGAFLGPFRA